MLQHLNQLLPKLQLNQKLLLKEANQTPLDKEEDKGDKDKKEPEKMKRLLKNKVKRNPTNLPLSLLLEVNQLLPKLLQPLKHLPLLKLLPKLLQQRRTKFLIK